MSTRALRTALLLGTLLLVLTACAPAANELAGTAAPGGGVPGFWLGLWHGAIAPITFIISLFNHSVGVYSVHNSGGWYNFGFLLGVSTTLGGSAGGGAARRRRR
jgi:hypothetical protein